MRKGEKESDMKRTWTSEELLEHFTLLPDELTAIGNKSGATRLGFAVLLKCLQYEGRFPHPIPSIPQDCAMLSCSFPARLERIYARLL
jgi:Domain of unknown function (DUF4158)